MFKYNGVEYDDAAVISCVRNTEIRQRSDNGYSAVTGARIQNIQGRFISYQISVDMRCVNDEQRAALYEALTASDEFGMFEFPYNDDSYSFAGFITGSISDQCLRTSNGRNAWGPISFTVNPKERKV